MLCRMVKSHRSLLGLLDRTKAVRFFETSATIYESKDRNIPQYMNFLKIQTLDEI
jgi:hypothetical protein